MKEVTIMLKAIHASEDLKAAHENQMCEKFWTLLSSLLPTPDFDVNLADSFSLSG